MSEQFEKWFADKMAGTPCGPTQNALHEDWEEVWNAALASRATAEMPPLDRTKEEIAEGAQWRKGADDTDIALLFAEFSCRERQLREAYAQIAALHAQVGQKDAENTKAHALALQWHQTWLLFSGRRDVEGWTEEYVKVFNAEERAEKAEQALTTAEESGIRKALETVKACDETGAEGLMWHEDAENAVRALLPSAESASKEPK